MSNTNGSSTSFFRIPGNIKMQMLPFVLNPGAKAFVQKNTEDGLQQVETSQDINITSNVLKSSDLNNTSIQPQIFSFKNVNKHYDNCYAKAQLNFLPSTFNRLNNDISFKMLYDNYSRHGSHSNDDYNASLANVTIDTILDTIPSVQIREFLPDTFLDQLMNFFSNFLNLFGKKEDSSTPIVSDNSSSSATSGILDKLASVLPGEAADRLVNVINGLLSYLAGDVTVNGQTLAETLGDGTDLDNWYTIKGKDKKLTSFIQNLPFLIYNCLQSTTTTNIYELPGYPIDKLAYSSDSSAGWENNNSIGLKKEFNNKLTEKLFGGLITKLIGNIRINYMPTWESESGSKTFAPEISIKFNLINDTADAAMRNFIFVNTIVPNSKWIQYGFFQQSSNLYDVKIDGFNRYFICSLKAIVKNSGIIRTPPQDWITHLCRQYGNKNMEGIETFADSIIANNLIKIPDSYEVELKFNSLLPDNYNTFLFNYYNNISITKNLKVYRDSIVNNFTTKGIEYMGAVFKYFWNNPIDTKTIDNSSK